MKKGIGKLISVCYTKDSSGSWTEENEGRNVDMERILKAWIHQEIEFDHQKELDDYQAKNPYVQVIETKASDGKKGYCGS